MDPGTRNFLLRSQMVDIDNDNDERRKRTSQTRRITHPNKLRTCIRAQHLMQARLFSISGSSVEGAFSQITGTRSGYFAKIREALQGF